MRQTGILRPFDLDASDVWKFTVCGRWWLRADTSDRQDVVPAYFRQKAYILADAMTDLFISIWVAPIVLDELSLWRLLMWFLLLVARNTSCVATVFYLWWVWAASSVDVVVLPHLFLLSVINSQLRFVLRVGKWVSAYLVFRLLKVINFLQAPSFVAHLVHGVRITRVSSYWVFNIRIREFIMLVRFVPAGLITDHFVHTITFLVWFLVVFGRRTPNLYRPFTVIQARWENIWQSEQLARLLHSLQVLSDPQRFMAHEPMRHTEPATSAFLHELSNHAVVSHVEVWSH